MTRPRTVTHGTFSLERRLDAPPARVYAAFATLQGKQAWFRGGDEQTITEHDFDFREGGTEHLVGKWASGRVSQFDARYFDIVPDERIVYAYEMHIDGTKISVSLATIEFKAEGAGTRLLLSETGAFLDGYDDAGAREHGTNFLMDRMAASLARELAS
ncbi:MAG TPA: SRPBCC family protein [Caulobacteraceae bacterium]|nr:SRPBCC family protein [Caulobacteraceae bacterium]